MSTQILNLTPHEINIGTASIKPFGVVARVYVESISDGEFTTASGTTIPISHSYYGDVENLQNPLLCRRPRPRRCALTCGAK